ncbi:MAG: AAA family ATPase [Putridiphycobacter sp.]
MPVFQHFFSDLLLEKPIFQEQFKQAINNFDSKKQVTLYISGDSGVGKKYLIKDLSSKFSNFNIYHGYYSNQKFNSPYAGIRQIIESIFGEVEQYSTEDFEKWKKGLNFIFASHFEELNSLSDGFSKFIEPKLNRNNSPTSPEAQQKKISNILINFIEFQIEFSQKNTLLIIENIQWIDEESLNLIYNLLQKKINNLMLVLSEQADQEGNLKAFSYLNKNKRNSEQICHFKLQNLHASDIKFILEKNFIVQPDFIDSFTDFCFKHSKGFIDKLHAIFSKLHNRNQLVFRKNKFELVVNEISLLDDFSENSISYLFSGLRHKELEFIKICACFSENINLTLIAKIWGIPMKDLTQISVKLLKIGILKPYRFNPKLSQDETSYYTDPVQLKKITNFRFMNELFFEHAKGLLSSESKRQIHKKFAFHYLTHNILGIEDRDLFETLFHLNQSINHEASLKEKHDHCKLNLRAANLAKKTASYSLALDHIQECTKFNMHLNWKNDYDLCATVNILGYEMARINKHEALKQTFLTHTSKHCNSLDQNKLRLTDIILDLQEGHLDIALKNGIKALNNLGIKVNENANKLSVLKEFLNTRKIIKKHNTQTILNLPELHEEKFMLAQEIIFWMYRSAQYINPTLNGVLALKSLKISLINGTYGNAYSGFMAYGVIIGSATNNYESAYYYCEIGNKLAEKYNNNSGGVQFGKAIYSAFRFALKDTFIYYDKAKTLSLQSGDILAATEPTVNESLVYLAAGVPLEEVKEKVSDNLAYCQDLNVKSFSDFQTTLTLHLKKLQNQPLSDSEKNKLEHILANTSYNFTPVVHQVLRIQYLCLNHQWESALKVGLKLKKDSQVLNGLNVFTEYHFYLAIAFAKTACQSKGIRKVKFKRKLKSEIGKFEKWSKSAPENFKHKLDFLNGLLANLNGHFETANTALLESAKTSEKLGFIQVTALAYSVLAEINKTKGINDSSAQYLQKANDCFNQWGFVKH